MCNNGDVLSWSNCSAGHGDNERYMLAVQVARSTDAGHYKTLPQHHQSCRRRCRCIWLQFVADTTRVDTPARQLPRGTGRQRFPAAPDSKPEVDLAGRASITVVD